MSREDEIRVAVEMLVNVIRRAIEDDVRSGAAGAVASYGSHTATRVKVQASKLTSVSSPKNILAWLREQTSYMSVAQAGRLVKKHPETVYRLILEEGLPAVKDHQRWKIDPNQLADWLESRGFGCVAPSQLATRQERGGTPTTR